MQGGVTPTLAVSSGPLALLKTNAFAWGTGAGPATTAPNTGTWAYFNVQLQNKLIPCTEIVASRQTGDTLLPVRDASIFSPNTRLVILQVGTAAPVAEATVATSSTGVVSLTAGLAALPPNPSGTAVNVSQSSLACAMSGAGTAAVSGSYTTSYPGGTIPTGTDAKVITLSGPAAANAFFIGQQVLVYEPASTTNNTAPLADLRTVSGVDTGAGAIIVNAAVSTGNSSVTPPTGHTAATVVMPLPPLGGEYALRGATDIGFGGVGLKVDALATTSTLSFTTSPASFPPMVGDTLLIDGDGRSPPPPPTKPR